MKTTMRALCALAAATTIALACKHKTPEKNVDQEAKIAISAEPSTSASTAPKKPDRCMLEAPDGLDVTKGRIDQLALLETDAGDVHLSIAQTSASAFRVRLRPKQTSVERDEIKGSEPRAIVAPLIVDGDVAWVGEFDPAAKLLSESTFGFAAGGTKLTLPMTVASSEGMGQPSEQFARRLAVAADATHWAAISLTSILWCPDSPMQMEHCSLSYEDGNCSCVVFPDRGGQNGQQQPDVSALRGVNLVAWTRDGEGLVSHDLFKDDDYDSAQTGPTSVAAVATPSGPVVAFVQTGGIFVLPIDWSGKPLLEEKKAIGGGDLGGPTIGPASDGKTWIVWPQALKPKQPRVIHFASFDPSTSKATMPRNVTPEAPIGSVVAPTIVSAGDGRIALAWIDGDKTKSRLFYGVGATPTDAVAAAVSLGTFDGEARDLALSVSKAGASIAWSLRTSPSAPEASVKLSRIACP